MKFVLVIYSKASGLEIARHPFDRAASAAAEWMLYVVRGFRVTLIAEE